MQVVGLSMLFVSLVLRAEDIPDHIQYNRDVRPIFSNTCFKCHGPDVKNNRSDLRLDRSESVFRPHKNAKGLVTIPIIAGKPDKSEVWRRISSSDSGVMMPPLDALHQLSFRDKQVVKRWIEQGAEYQAHWAYIAPVKVPLPEGTEANPVDRFIHNELTKRHIKESQESDKRVLLRRVSLDLTGLPPTPQEVEAFLSDLRSDAYERVVNRLLNSPHYGERMTVPWLDVVRFADTVGFHGDQRQNVFPYRDWVIEAFNTNKPYDVFITEQLAGDLLPHATESQRIASGFNRLNMVTREGGAQVKEYIAKYTADRVRTTSTAFLGSTMACCECHDHKYDPFSIKDFYSMGAYFADIKQYGVYSDSISSPEPELAGMDNDSPFLPQLNIHSASMQKRMQREKFKLEKYIEFEAAAIVANPKKSKDMLEWTSQVREQITQNESSWVPLNVKSAKAADRVTATILPDQSVRILSDLDALKSDNPRLRRKLESSHLIVLSPRPGPIARFRLVALPEEMRNGYLSRIPDHLSVKAELKFSVVRSGQEIAENIIIADGYSESESQNYDNGYPVAAIHGYWISSNNSGRVKQCVDYLLKEPLVLKAGDTLKVTLNSPDIAHVQFYASALGSRLPEEEFSDVDRGALLATEKTPEQNLRTARLYFLATGGRDQGKYTTCLSSVRAVAQCRDGRAETVVTVAVKPLPMRILPRGNWQDENGMPVVPEPPDFLTTKGTRKGAQRDSRVRQTRLDLAHWITSPDNPLTSRTFVNRTWRQFFGIGLSSTADDLGQQGEYPSHPELLDWLAVDFIEHHWDVKNLVRLIVTSQTYKQTSKYRPELKEIDPQNRLLARQTPRRLDAEFIRDNVLSVSGLLDDEIGGPSATPYQPEGYYASLNYPIRDYHAEVDERQYRRGLYMHWQRTFLHPMLANFDAPSREECIAYRTTSSTPQQALTLLNDPTFVEAARVLAQNVLLENKSGDFNERLNKMFLRVLARTATKQEALALSGHLVQQLDVYSLAPLDASKFINIGLYPVSAQLNPVELAAWTSVGRIILNLNETIVAY